MSSVSNSVNFVYCELENSTYCNVTGPWVKLASWNIAESDSSCPSGLQLFVNGTVSACGIQVGASPTCQPLPLFSSPVPYTQVCGRMRGYQIGSPVAFSNYQASSIVGPYVDRVSITHRSPRQHIWSFGIGLLENVEHFPRAPALLADLRLPMLEVIIFVSLDVLVPWILQPFV